MPSFEIGYTAPESGGTYHSAYDDLYNMEQHLDPGFIGHANSARIVGLTSLRLANATVLPFHYSDYAAAVAGYVTDLQAVQAETPGTEEVDLGILLEAAGPGARPRSGSRRAPTRCCRRATRSRARRPARSSASTAR